MKIDSLDLDNLEDISPKEEKEEIEDLFNDMEDYGGFSDTTTMERHNDLLKQLTDFDPFLKKMISEWLGQVWSEEKNQYVADPLVKPVMNIKGARWCITTLRTYARNNNILVNLDKQDYRDYSEDIIDVIWLNIGTRAEEFGIKGNGDVLMVCTQLLHSAQLVLKGSAANKKYTDLIGTTVQRSETVNVQDGQSKPMQKKGFLDKFRGWMPGG